MEGISVDQYALTLKNHFTEDEWTEIYTGFIYTHTQMLKRKPWRVDVFLPDTPAIATVLRVKYKISLDLLKETMYPPTFSRS